MATPDSPPPTTKISQFTVLSGVLGGVAIAELNTTKLDIKLRLISDVKLKATLCLPFMVKKPLQILCHLVEGSIQQMFITSLLNWASGIGNLCTALTPFQKTAIAAMYVEGDIQRVSLNSSEELQLAAARDAREKIAIYAALGIWYDSLTMLAQLYKANPHDTSLVADWQSLLQSIQLENVAKAPLVN